MVALRPAGLDERSDASIEREVRPVGEREEGVRREDGSVQRMAELSRLVDRDAHGVDAAHLPGADSDRLPASRDDDVVAAADAAGVSMVFTGRRHFRH